MASSTSGTTEFNLDVDEIIEEALSPLGGEYTSGIEIGQVRRKLNLILIQLQNKNIPLNKIDTYELPLVEGTYTYTLPVSINDVFKITVSDSAAPNPELDIELTRYSRQKYHTISPKDEPGRPNLFVTDRQEDAVRVTFWMVPNTDNYTAKMLVSKRVEDVTASYQKLDISYRYLPLIIKWLTYEVAMSRVGIPQEVKNNAKMDKEEAMNDAFDEDRERTDFVVLPGGISGS